jgi:hypothetical protein
MDSAIVQIQKPVDSNADVLLPGFRTLAAISGLAILSTGLTKLFSLAILPTQSGIPLKSSTPTPNAKRTGNNESVVDSSKDYDSTKAWIAAWTGLEIFLSPFILSLLYLRENKALVVVITLGNFVSAADAIATSKGSPQ